MTNMNETPDTIATICSQLGGRRIFAVAFQHATYNNAGNSAIFHIAKALVRNVKSKATHVTVTLASDDTYTVLVQRVPTARQWARGQEIGIVETGRLDGVHAAELCGVVETMTGLRLTLGSMGATS
jgi:hypothetical protein